MLATVIRHIYCSKSHMNHSLAILKLFNSNIHTISSCFQITNREQKFFNSLPREKVHNRGFQNIYVYNIYYVYIYRVQFLHSLSMDVSGSSSTNRYGAFVNMYIYYLYQYSQYIYITHFRSNKSSFIF